MHAAPLNLPPQKKGANFSAARGINRIPRGVSCKT
jgi:hypothetical protein